MIEVKKCGAVDCPNPLKTVGYCHTHYLRYVFDSQKYERTKKGFLVRKYRNMESRISGVQKKKRHLYAGKSLLARSDFYEWSMASDEFHRLHAQWVESGYERRLCPSVDRVDPSYGYELWNMEWVTMSVNCSRSAYTRSLAKREYNSA